MNIANMSRRTRRWSGASSRCSSASRRVPDTISILRGLKEKYELHHGVRITDARARRRGDAVSNRYITDRFLPDKAIDLMDEAASRIRMEVESKPEEIENLDRRIIQLKIEREALKKEQRHGVEGPARKARGRARQPRAAVGRADPALAGREGQDRAAKPRSRNSSTPRGIELEQAQRNGDLAKAGELQYGRIPELEKQLTEAAGRRQRRDAARGSHRPRTSPPWSAAGPASRSSG